MARAYDRALRGRLENLTGEAIAAALADDVLKELAEPAAQSAAAAAVPEDVGLHYDSLPDFVRDFLAPAYARNLH